MSLAVPATALLGATWIAIRLCATEQDLLAWCEEHADQFTKLLTAPERAAVRRQAADRLAELRGLSPAGRC